MSSNGEKGMMKRSDFAQKLLDDLRVRKERLSISQDTDNYAYSNRVFKGSRERRTKSTTFEEFNYGGSDKSLTSGTEVSNQILPYGKGRSIDLSKALAFALENAGKAKRADPSGNASVISFLHEVGKRSLGLGTSERRSSQQQLCSSSQQQLPMVHVHIKEISKGAQKLNQIIKACSNGLSFRKGRYSLQYGEEQHMEGAIELEESLRLLVDIQQASSEYLTKKHSQNRFKLLEENDDEEEEEEEQEDVWNRNNRKIKETAKADIEMRLLALNSKHRRQTSGCEDKPQKGRIPNVVAKLMGIGEFPEEEKETKNNNDASIKYAESLTRRIANENIVELKDQRSSTSLDLVFHKETQRATNGINYKDKSQHKDYSNSRKGNKKDGETTTKNAIRRNSSSPTEDKPKAVTRSQEKPLHKLSLGKKDEAKSIKKAKLKPERHQEHGAVTNHPPKPLSSVPVTEKSKALRKSFSHVVVLEKKKGGELHEAEFREKKNQDNSNLNGGFCKARKQPENQKPVSKEANRKHDQLLRSYNDSNKTKAVEAERCVNTSEMVQSSNRNVLEQKKDIKDDSILLIAAERVLRQAPSENHHELMFTDVVDQQAPISNSDGNSERFSKAVYKVVSASEGEVEAGIPLLEKRQEDQKQDTKDTLSENEMNLKKIVVKSQLFLDTFEALFKLNIPLSVLREVGGNNYYQEDKNLLLDCGYEIMKRKGRFQELSVHPFVKVAISSSKVNSLDHIVRQLSKEFEKLRTYGRECYTESLVQDYLPKVLERDVHHKDPNLNSMWDMGWNDSMNAFIEKDDVIRDVEREVFNGLLEEITRDLICI